ncbi:MAG: M23 family metallopeptidase [Cyclobacteriaceae bacterium]
MRYTTYRYNTQTCQYERVRIKAKDIIWYFLGLVVTGSWMLLGILLLHDLVVNTDNERMLRRENRALKQHHAILSEELRDLQPVLTSLQNKDRILHARFFGGAPEQPLQSIDRASKQNLLLADAKAFRKQISSMKETSQQWIRKSSSTNRYFGNTLKLNDFEMAINNSLPTLQPISPWQADRVISGFGLRVNPFHKGLYDHLGVDLAMPRGTPVVATGSGVVLQLKRSPLQAGYGNYIEIDHGHGLVTRYAHLEDINVKFGAKVKKGEVIGTIGTSGGSVAPHVHYEILRDGKNVDPIHYMVEGLTSEQHHHLTLISHKQNQSLD